MFKAISKKLFRSDVEFDKSKNMLHAIITDALWGKYKSLRFGLLWHFFPPILLIFLYYFVWTLLGRSDIPDFWIYLSSAIFAYNFMLTCLVGGTTCIIGNSNYIKKMYFPREILPLSFVISNFIIFLVGYILVLIIVILYGYSINLISILFSIVVLCEMFFFSLGCVFIVSVLTLLMRDLQYFLSSLSLMFFTITPMYFFPNAISDIQGKVVWLNPFTYFVESFHSCIYYCSLPSVQISCMCIVFTLITLIFGYMLFKKYKGSFVKRL